MKQETLQEVLPCEIFIDKEGTWFHRGAEIVRKDIIQLLSAGLERDDRNRYILHWDGNACSVEVEDTAFVVRRVDERDGSFSLHLSDDSIEELSPKTLSTGPDDVPYCLVKKDRFPARFTRAAYYQLAEHIEEKENGVFFLRAGEKKHPIPRAQQLHQKV
jgi:uncharacterized protein